MNIGVTACLYGLSVGVMTEGHSDKKCFDIKCLVTYGVCKTLEPNKSPRANPIKLASVHCNRKIDPRYVQG